MTTSLIPISTFRDNKSQRNDIYQSLFHKFFDDGLLTNKFFSDLSPNNINIPHKQESRQPYPREIIDLVSPYLITDLCMMVKDYLYSSHEIQAYKIMMNSSYGYVR